MRAVICGGRDFIARNWMFARLDRVHARSPITEVIEGGALGADRLARRWAVERGIRVTTVRADWDRYGKSAGYRRNIAMADLDPVLVIAAPGGTGTQMMIDIARTRGIGIIKLEKLKL